ncbi:MAG: hypothetical protein DI534_05970 [Leifsonia xyli]|nr:MAG: hypothetical protein DI534_05970 [Leifsonia xyli]
MDIPALAPSVAVPFRVTVGATLVTAFAGLGLAIYDLVASGWSESFLYATGRSLVFLFIAIAVSIARWPAGAVLAAGAIALVNVLDTVVGVIRGDALFIVAPIVLALVSGAAALWLNAAIRRSR